MLVLDKDRIKNICNSYGLKLGWVIDSLGITRSHFNNMTYMRMINGKVVPVVNIKSSIFLELEKLFKCTKENFTYDTSRLQPNDTKNIAE